MEAGEFNVLLKIMNRSEKAVEKIYKFYYPRIVKHLSINYGRTLAEDVAQEFFLHLFEICEKQPFIKNPTSWIYTCADNIAKRKIIYDSRYTGILHETVASDTIANIENLIYAEELLSHLNSVENKIVYMIHWEGYSKKEIATILDLKYANVRKIYSRALSKLKKYL